MQAVIMAGGKGTRLGPYTAIFPKPLMPIGNEMPILELLLRQFKRAGVTEVILAVNHLHHLIRAFFESGEKLGLDIIYHLEDRPLGTAGALASLQDQLKDSFFVANGDLLTTLDFAALMKWHIANSHPATVAVYEREINSDFGVLDVREPDTIEAYREKPVSKHLVSMGLYAFSKDQILPHIKVNQYLDMPDLIRSLIDNGDYPKAFKQKDCFWLDIGRPDDYAKAQEVFLKNPKFFGF